MPFTSLAIASRIVRHQRPRGAQPGRHLEVVAAAHVVAGADVDRLVPADFTSSSTDACAPLPSATIVITAATPMIMPSIVRNVRSLCRPSAFSAMTEAVDASCHLTTSSDCIRDRSASIGSSRAAWRAG